MKGFKSAGFILVGALTLAGCGGGGGDDPVELVTLSEQNAANAASATYSASSVAAASSDMGAAMLSAAAVEPRSGRFMLADFAKEQLDKVVQNSSQFTSNMVRAATVYTESGTCSAGGTTSAAVDDADNNGYLSAGDSITVTFNNCAESVGTTINGSLTLTGITVTDIPSPYLHSVGASFSFNITVNSGGESLSIKGSYAFSVATNDNVMFTTTVSSNALTLTRTDTSGSQTTTLRDYSATSTGNTSTGEYWFTSHGTIDDSRLNGRITFNTPTPFAGVNPGYPTAGVMKISGKSNSSVTLEAMSDGNTVRLYIDADGDGTAETFIDKTWVALDS